MPYMSDRKIIKRRRQGLFCCIVVALIMERFKGIIFPATWKSAKETITDL
ncbi:hypothetical protein Hanom_Chr13g01219961 [Helianthus anomalus]